MTLPTTSELIARLKAVYGVHTDEELARRLDVRLRSLSRWKSGKGMTFQTAVDLLNRAGWLAVVQKIPSRDHLAAAEREAALALEQAKRLATRPPDGRAKGESSQ